MFYSRRGNINYLGDVAISAAAMLFAKLLLSSSVSTTGARFMTKDTSHFYLMPLLKRLEFISIQLWGIPKEITEECNLKSTVTANRSIYVCTDKRMHRLHKNRLLTNALLEA